MFDGVEGQTINHEDYIISTSDYTQHDTDYSYVPGNSQELLSAY